MKRWVALALFMIPLLVSAESFWEGNAALQRGDSAFESSLSAVSNSFPAGTRVMVQDLDTGKSTAATISGRAGGQSDILILLSPKAADAVGLSAGTISRVRVTILEKPPAAAAGSSELASSPDPDLNPGGTYQGQTPSEQAATAQETAQAPPTDQPQESTTQQGAQAAGAQAAEQPTGEQPQGGQTEQPQQAAEEPQKSASASSEDEQILAEAEARQPQKQLFLPPREDETFAYHAPQQAPAEAARGPAAEQQAAEEPQAPAAAEKPSVIGETHAPAQEQQAAPLAEAQPQSPGSPREVSGVTAEPAPAEAGAQLALPQAGSEAAASPTEASGSAPAPSAEGEKPSLTSPEAPAQAETAVAPPEQAQGQEQIAAVPSNPRAAETSSQVQTVATLPKLASARNSPTFYLQLGAYATEEVALSMAGRLTPTYPVVVLAPSPDAKQMYRVLVGPLNKAESGTLLPLFKFRGFRDAFIRRE